MISASDIRVVVVDDEPDIRQLLQIQLGFADGFEVVGMAAEGAEAVQVVGDTAPDAVVMDLLMPGVNGFDCITVLRREFPDVGVVAYTGVAGEFVRNEMERRGVEVVLKSGDVRPLTDAILRSLPSRRVSRE